VKNKNFAAITDSVKVGEFMRSVDAFKGTLTVQCALRLAPLVFVRPGELRQANGLILTWNALSGPTV
jgi:hypothetical protein